MTKLKFEECKDLMRQKLDVFQEVWPYLTHPKRILQLKDSVFYWQERLRENSAEALKDAYVQSLKDELTARKKAYDEAERLHEQDLEDIVEEYEFRIEKHKDHIDDLKWGIEDLNDKLAAAYADNAELCAERAAAIAEAAYLRACQTNHAVSTPQASADR